MDGGQKVELPVIALTMGSLHGIHGKSELGHGLMVVFNTLHPLEELTEFPVGAVSERMATI